MKHHHCFALSLATLSLPSFLFAESDTILVPEGKVINHASMFENITPSAGPRVIGGVGMFFTGDYIYWTAKEEQLEFAVAGVTLNNSTTGGTNMLPSKRGSKYSPHTQFHSGLKAGVGFSFGHDKWDMYFDYTWYISHHNHGSVHRSTNTLINLIPIGASNMFDLLNSARSNWNLDFNVVDGELGRNFYVSKFLSIRPFFGGKATWQMQRNNIDYDFANGVDLESKNKLDFWGAGIRMGANTTWHLAGTWSIYADLAVSALWGVTHVRRTDKQKSTHAMFYETKENLHALKPVIEASVGLRKEEWFFKDRFHIAVEAGWEEQVWFNQNNFDYYTSPRDGNLILQGFTGKVRFDF